VEVAVNCMERDLERVSQSCARTDHLHLHLQSCFLLTGFPHYPSPDSNKRVVETNYAGSTWDRLCGFSHYCHHLVDRALPLLVLGGLLLELPLLLL
jgi:hypothetical protein